MSGALLAGAAQIVLMDRVPAHAAINHAVEWCKLRIRPGAGALANAVLRRVAERVGEKVSEPWNDARNAVPLMDGSVRKLTEPLLPEDARERLAAATSVPAGLLARWEAAFGAEVMQSLAMRTLANPPTVVRVDQDAEAAEDADLSAHEQPGYAVFRGSFEALNAMLERRRSVFVQDAGSGQAVEAAARWLREKGVTPRVIVDLCAGQGTKTRQLLAMFPKARVVATDTDERRLKVLEETLRGVERAEVMPPVKAKSESTGVADLVLADVPCSNTGVLARRVEAKYRVEEKMIARLNEIQRDVVADSMRLLKPGGVLLYSTCSLEREEDEAIVEWAASSGRFEVVAQQKHLPTGGAGQALASYRDGSFWALLRLREGDAGAN
jgi:16S rRNA (cytosine967-C5)-methyltransferase